MKHNSEEQYNPFDDILFWLQLACTDFYFGFDEVTNKELDTPVSENQSTKGKRSIQKPIYSKNGHVKTIIEKAGEITDEFNDNC
jgi:hypothetical protein